ncbi:MAG: hypothetical protein JWM52_363 [Candidatus Saccharibacteria bacterium]|nr:hypothetical protein [Candidatus Saccharibacteria bacterium]
MNPTDQQPTQPAPSTPTPTVVPQPSTSTAVTSGVVPLTKENTQKQKKLGLILGIVSIVAFIISLFIGYTAPFMAILGAYSLYIGIRTKTVGLIVLGSFGTILNLGIYTLAVFTNL